MYQYARPQLVVAAARFLKTMANKSRVAIVRRPQYDLNIPPMLVVGMFRGMRFTLGSRPGVSPLVVIQVNNIEFELAPDDEVAVYELHERISLMVPFGDSILDAEIPVEPPVAPELVEQAIRSIRAESDKRLNHVQDEEAS